MKLSFFSHDYKECSGPQWSKQVVTVGTTITIARGLINYFYDNLNQDTSKFNLCKL